jgi:DNA polymerase I-like protein with 3'-5' exonuclease and polymerase domains
MFKQLGLAARSVGTVHDAINFEVPIAEAPEVVPLIRRVMEDLPLDEFGCHMDVPIIADVKIGRRWGSALEVPAHISSDGDKLNEWLREHTVDLGIG